MGKAIDILLTAVEDQDSEKFLELCSQHNARTDGYDFEELLQTLPKREQPRLSVALDARVESSLTKLQSALENKDEENVADQEATLAILRGTAILSRALLQECGVNVPSTLHAAAVKLHDSQVTLIDAACDGQLQEAVVRLCESWWQMEAAGRECLVTQTLPYLLVRSLSTGRTADVRRVHALRSALQLFEFDDESIISLKKLLLRCAFAPPFLRVPEGRRFLSSLFCIQPQFTRELQAIVRNQIPSGRRSILEAYGEILFRAWRNATGPCLAELEYGCMQGLMKAALHASTPAMGAALRRVLGGFHSQKSAKGVDEMLLRLYEPLLFRAVQAANPAVRTNAARVLFDCFPLQNPEAPNEDIDRLMQEQFKCFTGLLKDEVPAVRALAIGGVVGVLDVYWELIPAATTASYIACIVDDLVHDCTSPAVRAEAISGLARLVHNPLAQPVLKAVLPRLKNMMMDHSRRVRVAMVKLLLEVRSVRAIRFYEVVPVEMLLTGLANEDSALAHLLTQLLLPSYCPPGSEVEEVVERLVALLEKTPRAGAALLRHMVSQGATPATAMAIAEGLWQLLKTFEAQVAVAKQKQRRLQEADENAAPTNSAAQKKRKGKRRNSPDQEKAGEQELTEAEPIAIPNEIWESVSMGLAALTPSIKDAGKAFTAPLSQLFAVEDLARVYIAAPTEQARSHILEAAMVVPATLAGELRQRCMQWLLRGSSLALGGSGAGSEVERGVLEQQALVRCVCAWGGAADLVQAVAIALTRIEDDADVATSAAAGDSRVTKRTKGGAEPQAALSADLDDETPAVSLTRPQALQFVEVLLQDERSRAALIRGGHLATLLPHLRTTAMHAVRGAVDASASTYATAALVAQGKVAFHLTLTREAQGRTQDDTQATEEVRAQWESVGSAAPDLQRVAAEMANEKQPAASPQRKKKKKPTREGGAGGRAAQASGEAEGQGAEQRILAYLRLVEASAALAAEAAALGQLRGAGAASVLESAAKGLQWTLALSDCRALQPLPVDAAAACSRSLGHFARLAHQLASRFRPDDADKPDGDETPEQPEAEAVDSVHTAAVQLAGLALKASRKWQGSDQALTPFMPHLVETLMQARPPNPPSEHLPPPCTYLLMPPSHQHFGSVPRHMARGLATGPGSPWFLSGSRGVRHGTLSEVLGKDEEWLERVACDVMEAVDDDDLFEDEEQAGESLQSPECCTALITCVGRGKAGAGALEALFNGAVVHAAYAFAQKHYQVAAGAAHLAVEARERKTTRRAGGPVHAARAPSLSEKAQNALEELHAALSASTEEGDGGEDKSLDDVQLTKHVAHMVKRLLPQGSRPGMPTSRR
ncbi:hypothetical protein CYMTET_46231 [Cymbomonas tetramitiformis]|uniref:Uncharacterized protein n=2 Tax=Cymbomonas tetramitiformis TaxID=36881 RepID=A0AAE0EX92_9CHLO|nr:hypothetical protein CYMTET_46231 [Cymbomonas tetramitiformis]